MSDAAAFVGRFHPLLVHFPIAFLLLAGALELLALRGAPARRGSPRAFPLLVVAAITAAIAASAGYLLGTSGGYGGPTFERHLQLGIVVAIGALITALAAWRRQRTGAGDALVRTGLALTLATLTAAGHLGATLTHGEGYLTEFAPAPLRTLLAGVSGAPAAAAFSRPGRARARLPDAGAAGAAAPLRVLPRGRRGPRRPRARHARGDPQGRRSRPRRDARAAPSPASWCAACGCRPITRT